MEFLFDSDCWNKSSIVLWSYFSYGFYGTSHVSSFFAFLLCFWCIFFDLICSYTPRWRNLQMIILLTIWICLYPMTIWDVLSLRSGSPTVVNWPHKGFYLYYSRFHQSCAGSSRCLSTQTSSKRFVALFFLVAFINPCKIKIIFLWVPFSLPNCILSQGLPSLVRSYFFVLFYCNLEHKLF